MLPYHYLTPKWQAEVKPGYKTFWAVNGQVIRNLWQLKLAFKELPDEVWHYHVNDYANHFADWVHHVVWDQQLAHALRSTTQRWGLIVALERHQMRTLNLPPYLAARWLANTEESFYLANGRYVWSLTELKHALMEIDDSTFEQHLQAVPNDFVNWILGSIGDYQLAEILSVEIYKSKFLIKLSDHLEMLHEAGKEY